MGAVELGVLGPLSVRVDGNTVALGGQRQRALLAVLALRANEVVSTDRLIDELWGDNPPATAVHTIQVFVSRLRGALGPAGARLLTRPPGYVLELGVDEVDASRCERLYETARSALNVGDAARAAELLREAQSLWRGAPLAEFTYEPFAQATIARLEELRVSCREESIEAELALGRHAEVVSELEALVREHPLRERPRGQLMLALYRCGRQAEALDAFQQARRMLVEELAVEPGEGLRELEQAILRQDASLQLPSLGSQPAPVRGPSEPIGPLESIAGPEATAEEQTRPVLRRMATVLVARLTTVAGTDPELARRSMTAARERAEEIVTRHAGVFVAAFGGQLVWVFGLPRVNEDDAVRAVRASDELRTNLATAIMGDPGQLTVRVGLATGEVVAEETSDMFGEPLTRGMSLTEAAQAGEVLLSETTQPLVSNVARLEPALDGTAWRLVRLVGPDSLRLQLGIPMIGRDNELAGARACFDRACRSQSAHLLTVLGDPGIGKSRLAQEVVDGLAGEATILTGRCLSYGEGIAFWPLREALTGTARGESREALGRLLEGAEDAELVGDTVAATLGLAGAPTAGEQVPWAFRRLFEVLSNRRPLILVIEDAHWAQTPLLDLIDYLVDWLQAPAMVMCLARPELLEARPGWGGGHARVSSFVLAPLAAEDALQLLHSQLGERQLTAEETARILETSEGNPLFVEQLLRTSAEDPLWDRAPHVPATIQGILAARLDRLGPGERTFIERAALIGREFWPAAVVELLPTAARSSAWQHLGALVHRGLIHPDRSTVAGEEQLRFHHILIRDVAYRSTPKSLRCELHERFADWLAERGQQYDEFVGYHLEQAFHYRSELGRTDEHAYALAVRAGEHLAAAGRRALMRWDTSSGVNLLRTAADLFGASGKQRPDVLLDLGSALSENADFGGAEPVLQAALEQAQDAGDEAVVGRALIELSHRLVTVESSTRVAEMIAVAQEAIAVFTRLGDDAGLSRALLHVAKAHWISCRCAEMEEVLEQALNHAERAGERPERARILSDLARATVTGPRPVEDAVRRCNTILERAMSDVIVTAVADTMLGVLEAMRGGFQEARDRWTSSRRELEQIGLGMTVANLQMYRAFVELLAGTPGKAERDLIESYTVLERVGEHDRLATTAALLARVLYAQGRYDEADHYRQISEENSSRDDVVSLVIARTTQGKLLARAGNTKAAKSAATSGVELAGNTDFLMLHGDALTDRAAVFAILDRPKEARRDLKQAISLYERKGMVVSARAADRFCQSLAPDSAAPAA